MTDTSRRRVSNKRAALVVLALADLMVVLDTTVVFISLPSIQRALHFSSTSSLQWVVNAYVLAFGGFLLLGGRVADRVGRRLVFVAGVAGFAAASLACGLATSEGMLIAARATQGLGAAFMAPAALSLVTAIFAEGDERNRALGLWGAIASSGAAVGLVAGGALITWFSWRWAFFVNVPIGAFAAVASVFLIGETRNTAAAGFDVMGAASATGGLAALVFGLVSANQWGWESARSIGVFAAATILLAVFVGFQVRGHHPLVPPRLFRQRNLIAADIDMLLVGAGVFAMFLFLTLYMQQVLGYSAIKTGVGYLAVTATSITSATIAARNLSRLGARRILMTCFVMVAAGLALLVRISPATGYLEILPSLVLIGGGNGAAFVSMTSLAVGGVPSDDAGVASALLNASQQVGGSLGIAALTAVAAARFDAVRPRHPTPATLAAATTSSWVWAFAVAAILIAGAAVMTGLVMRPGRKQRSGQTLPTPTRTPEFVPLAAPCHGSGLYALADARPRREIPPASPATTTPVPTPQPVESDEP